MLFLSTQIFNKSWKSQIMIFLYRLWFFAHDRKPFVVEQYCLLIEEELIMYGRNSMSYFHVSMWA